MKVPSGEVTLIGKPAVYGQLEPAPGEVICRWNVFTVPTRISGEATDSGKRLRGELLIRLKDGAGLKYVGEARQSVQW